MPHAAAGQLKVVVASDQSLITEAVRAALADRGMSVATLRWDLQSIPPQRRGTARSFDVGLMISELDKWSRLRGVGALIAGVQVPWVVLTGAAYGPLWGAALDFGARAVVANSSTLQQVQHALEAVRRGEVLPSPAEAVVLREAWHRQRRQREALHARFDALTPREREVLRLLYAGDSVLGIAASFQVAPATVRSQVKSILRKLDVNSQLAAVAAYAQLLELDDSAAIRQPRAGNGG